jgi:hypothetical protein
MKPKEKQNSIKKTQLKQKCFGIDYNRNCNINQKVFVALSPTICSLNKGISLLPIVIEDKTKIKMSY